MVDLFQIHVMRYSREEAELQTSTEEFSYNLIIILIDNPIIEFHSYACHVKIDHHIRLGLKRKTVFIKTDVLHSCIMYNYQRYLFSICLLKFQAEAFFLHLVVLSGLNL